MERRRLRRATIVDIVRGRSIARVTIGGETAVGTDTAIVMTKMVIGLESAGGGQGRDPETVSRTASVRTDIVRAHAQGSTGGIGREVKSFDARETGTEDQEITIAIMKERRVRGAREDVVPTAVGVDRGRRTSTQDRVETEHQQ